MRRMPLLTTTLFLLVLTQSPARAAPEGGLFETTAPNGAHHSLPAVESAVHLEVAGLSARATVNQSFLNPSDRFIEAAYVFPLPDGAAVDGLEIRIGERVIRGEIQEREVAQELYEQAHSEGRKAALVSQHEGDLFTTQVTGIGPGDRIDVTLRFGWEISYDLGVFRLTFPLVMAPRYTPAASLESVVLQRPEACEPERRASAVPERNRVDLTVDLATGFPLTRLESPTHAIGTTVNAGQKARIGLADGPVLADRDFVLEWQPQPGAELLAATYLEAALGYDHVQLMVQPPPPAYVEPIPREVILVVDVSGSMRGTKLQQAKDALQTALTGLRPTDRFNLIRFDTNAEALFDESMPAQGFELVQGRQWVSDLHIGSGTEMLPALEAALRPGAPGYLRQIVFLTDGQVHNAGVLFRYISDHLGESRLFTVGIGSAPSSHFMKKAAHFGRGSYTFIHRGNEVADRMTELLARLEWPVVRDLEIDWGAPTTEASPERVPDLYVGEPLRVAARWPEGHGREITISGRLGDEPWSVRLPIDRAQPAAGMAKLWARRQVEEQMDTWTLGGDHEAIRKAITTLGLEYGLVTDQTSLVAVDLSRTVPTGEKTAQTVVPLEPTADPEGYRQFEGVEELITVTSESPLLDERRITTGTTVSKVQLEPVPAQSAGGSPNANAVGLAEEIRIDPPTAERWHARIQPSQPVKAGLFSRKRTEAFRVLLEAQSFGGGQPAELGRHSEEEKAWSLLLARPDAAQVFTDLLERGSFPGQLYALAALYQVAPEAYERAMVRFADHETEILAFVTRVLSK